MYWLPLFVLFLEKSFSCCISEDPRDVKCCICHGGTAALFRVRPEWINVLGCGPLPPESTAVVCSKHFCEKDIGPKGGLLSTAFPVKHPSRSSPRFCNFINCHVSNAFLNVKLESRKIEEVPMESRSDSLKNPMKVKSSLCEYHNHILDFCC